MKHAINTMAVILLVLTVQPVSANLFQNGEFDTGAFWYCFGYDGPDPPWECDYECELDLGYGKVVATTCVISDPYEVMGYQRAISQVIYIDTPGMYMLEFSYIYNPFWELDGWYGEPIAPIGSARFDYSCYQYQSGYFDLPTSSEWTTFSTYLDFSDADPGQICEEVLFLFRNPYAMPEYWGAADDEPGLWIDNVELNLIPTATVDMTWSMTKVLYR